MKRKEYFFAIGIAIILTGILFFKSLLFAQVPFPGDSLLSDFKPWQVTSYNGYGAGGIPNKAQYPDVIRQLYPWRIESMRQWKEGHAPLWNPYSFSGTPLLANFQSASLYPLNFLFFLFQDVASWTILIALQPFFAIVCTYLYLRRIKLSILASLFGAVSYGVSGFMTVWLEYNTVGHIMAWFPLGLYAIECLKDAKNAATAYIGCVLSIVLMLLAGHPQIALYAITFMAIYAFTSLKGTRLLYATLAILTGFGLAAIQLMSGIELISVAARANHTYQDMMKSILIQPWQTLMMFFPNLYGNPVSRTYWLPDTYVGKVTSIGLVPLFFLLSGLRLHKNTHVRFYIIASVILGLCVTANPITALLYSFSIPILSSSSPTLMIFLFSFSLATLTSFGIDGWLQEKHSVKKLGIRTIEIVTSIALIAACFLIFPYLKPHAMVAMRALLYGFAIASATLLLFYIAIRYKQWSLPVLYILFIVHFFDVSYAFFKFNPFVPIAYMYPSHVISDYLKNENSTQRFWGYGTAAIDANIATYWRTYSPNGYDPLYPKWYGEFIGASKNGKLVSVFDNANRSDATVAPGFGEEDFQKNIFRKQVLRTLGVAKIIDRPENGTSEKTFPSKTYTLKTVSDWRIFTDLESPPIVRIATKSVVARSRADFEQAFFNNAFDPRTDVIVSDEGIPALTGSGEVSSVDYKASKITTHTRTSKGPTMLVLANTYFNGWHAFIDDKPIPLYKVNWTMMGIVVPAGDHTITVSYNPIPFTMGLWVSTLSLVAFIGIVVFAKTKKIS